MSFSAANGCAASYACVTCPQTARDSTIGRRSTTVLVRDPARRPTLSRCPTWCGPAVSAHLAKNALPSPPFKLLAFPNKWASRFVFGEFLSKPEPFQKISLRQPEIIEREVEARLLERRKREPVEAKLLILRATLFEQVSYLRAVWIDAAFWCSPCALRHVSDSKCSSDF